MKQYYDTMAQLRFWRRSLAQSSEDEDQSLQGESFVDRLCLLEIKKRCRSKVHPLILSGKILLMLLGIVMRLDFTP